MGLYGATVFLLVLLFFAGLMAGSRWVSPTLLLSAIDGSSDLLTRITVLELRLPRNLLGILGGAALGVAGAVMQGVTRNSLASPGLTGVIASAGLDVLDEEPPVSGHPLAGLDNAIITPHTAGPTLESIPKRAANAFENIKRVIDGGQPSWTATFGNSG